MVNPETIYTKATKTKWTKREFYTISLIRSQTERTYGNVFCFKMRFEACSSLLKVQLTSRIFLTFMIHRLT